MDLAAGVEASTIVLVPVCQAIRRSFTIFRLKADATGRSSRAHTVATTLPVVSMFCLEWCGRKGLEARGGFEPPIKVLQTFALPLGYRALGVNAFYQMIDSTAVSNLGAVSKKKRGRRRSASLEVIRLVRLTDELEREF